MSSENVAEHEAVESAADVSAKAVDGQLIDELVSRAQVGGARRRAPPTASALVRCFCDRSR